MEVFKLLGTLALKGVDEAKQDLDNVTGKADQSSSKMTSAFKKLGGVIASVFAVNTIKNFGVAVVQASAEVAAEEAAFTQIMGKYSDEAASKVSKIAESTGMVDSRLTPYMTSMTAKFKGLGFDVEDATDLASTGLTIAADAAAFWDKSLDDSMGALNSFVNGNYEGGEAIGLFANETTLANWASENLGYTWKELSEKEKQFARLEFAKAMQEASGATGQASKESGSYQNVMGNLTETWRQFKAQVGEPLLNNVVIPAMKALGNFITNTLMPGFERLKQLVVENQETFKTIAKVMGVVVGALASLKAGELAYQASLKITSLLEKAQTLGKNLYAIATGKLTTAQIKAAAAQRGLNVAMLTSPITWIVAGIVALVAILVVAYNKSETFRNAVNKLASAFKNTLQKAFESIKPILKEIVDALMELWDVIWSVLGPVIDWIVGKIKQYMPAIKATISAVLSWLKTSFQNLVIVVKTTLNNIKVVIQTVTNVIKNIIKVFTSILKGDWKGAWEAIKNIFKSVWDGIKNIASNTLGGLKNLFSNTWNGIKNVTSKIWNGIRDSVTKPVKNAMDKVKEYIGKIKGFFTGFSAKIKMPHFKIKNASLNPKDWIKNGVPKLSVEWYAKGGIMTQPTIFDYNPSTNTAKVGGEPSTGGEVIAPLNTLLPMIESAIANEMNKQSEMSQLIYNILAHHLPKILENMKWDIVLDDKTLVAKLLPKIIEGIDKEYARKMRYA